MPQYLFYTLSSRLTATARVEVFDDFQGQRTGFNGLYTEVTGGLAFKLPARPHLPPRIALGRERRVAGLQRRLTIPRTTCSPRPWT